MDGAGVPAQIPFERYAGDVICHCRTEGDARALRRAIADRFAACRLVLHPEKTRIVRAIDLRTEISTPRPLSNGRFYFEVPQRTL
jgi:RNA-directed DNA polymerase